MIQGIKTCSKCKRELPANLDYFYAYSQTKDGLRSHCKDCWKLYSKKYGKKNEGKIKKRIKIWNGNNPEYHRKWREVNSDHIKRYRQNNKEQRREYHKEYMRNIRHSNEGPRLQFLKNIHRWIKRHKPNQVHCSICNGAKKLELSNISGRYKKDIDDYWYLCNPCHRLFDQINETHIKN